MSSSESLGNWAADKSESKAPVIDSQQSFVLQAGASMESLAGHIAQLGTRSDSQDLGGAELSQRSQAEAPELAHNVSNVSMPDVADQATSVEAGKLVRRRANKKRKKTAAETASFSAQAGVAPEVPSTPAGKRQCPEEDEVFEDPEEKFDRWVLRRTSCVDALKGKAEYERFAALRAAGGLAAMEAELGVPAPVTPDPFDVSLSKRTWEATTMKWRSGLRLFSGMEPSSSSGAQ